jgi:hypothetical protein
MIWLKRLSILTIIGAVLGLCSFEFFYFLYQPILDWLNLVRAASNVLLAVLSLGALITLRWRWIAIFAATWIFIFLPESASLAPFQMLNGEGFHVQVLLDGDYLSRCEMADVVENGSTQKVGLCQRYSRQLLGCDYVMYDTSRQFALPPWQRTPEWKRVINVIAEHSHVEADDKAIHLFGNFYRVFTYGDPDCGP